MRTNSILLAIFVIGASFLMTPSCKKNGNCNKKNISKNGSDESHNFGMNCMNCHASGGEGYGCFTAAGSVSNASLTTNISSGTVKFYTLANGGGTLKYEVAIDSKGNFHTTESNDYTGLFPAITGPNGTTNYMSSSVSSGACNSCHGVSTAELYGN
jgi:cytochrome c553